MSKLALFGGKPTFTGELPAYNTIDDREKRAVMDVLDSGVLSDFYGSYSPRFYGGPRVRDFEEKWAARFDVPFAVSVNSATSGLHAAVLAAGIGPGDEVIVPPWTMSATATAVLMANAVPVFADIDDRFYTIDPEAVRRAITPRTRAVIAVDLFGGPADLDPLLEICREHKLVLIEDNAQGPGGLYKGRLLGTVADMGVFSLNCHKVIQSGEGGVVVTRDEDLATRLRLVRNHGENVVEDMGWTDIANTLGYNYRLTETQAAIALVQMEKLDELTAPRIAMADRITERLSGRPEFVMPSVRPGDRHVYYVYPFRFLPHVSGFSRELFLKALQAEGLPAAGGYVRPLYLAPMYQRRLAHGSKGCPFACPWYKGALDYRPGLCPTVERLWRDEFICTTICRSPLGRREADLFADAIAKILDAKDELIQHE